MLEHFISSLFRNYLWEFSAAFAGVLYLRKVEYVPKIYRLLAYYLCFIFVLEVVGMYNLIAYYSDYTFLGFIKDTPFRRNYWLYNSVKPLAFLVYYVFFISQLRSKKTRKILYWLSGIFVVTSYLYIILSGSYFVRFVIYTPLVGALILFICIALYLLQMIRSESILSFHKNLSFYVAVGALIWHLGFTPMFLYNKIAVMNSTPQFVEVYFTILGFLNFVMYGFYTLGFIIEIRKNRQKKRSGETLVRFD